MATVLRLKGYHFRIYTKEPAHERPHVHVIAKIWLDDLSIAVSRRYKIQEQQEILILVREHQTFLMQKWEEIHHGA
jgi:hypothetical protein